MGKKGNRPQASRRSRQNSIPWITVAAIVAILFIVSAAWIGTRTPTRTASKALSEASHYARRENRLPMSPALFVGQTARAYQIAHEIPEVLDQLYCYCECDKHLGHRSLLSCFIDSHAAT